MTEPPAAAARPVLVLYAPADEPFVRGFLLCALGQTPGIEVHGAQVIDAHDLAAIALDELEQALRRSGVAIAVISAAFLTNQWSRYSELLASSAAVENALDVIPLVLDGCTLPLHIKAKLGLDFQAHDRWDGEAQRLRAYLARPAPVEPDLPCPYPGMRPFQAADAASFHGRDGELTALLALMTAGEREITLVGPSGSGKSSLIAAGLLQRLATQPGAGELIVRAMRPGDAPLRRLAECLEFAADATPDAAAVAAWTARHAGARLVVVVDQLEELFAQVPRAEQAGFAAAIGALRSEPRCLIVLALRADFYGELLQSPLWLDGPRQHIDLTPLLGPAMRQAIELPARALEVYFEPGLIDRLLADAAEEPGALPMLQETLVQLWGHRRRRLLTRADYDALGDGRRSGLAVAIAARADRCLGEMTPAQVAIAHRILLRLVSFGEGRPNTRRRQTRAQFAGGEPPAALEDVLRLLVAARLITLDGDGHPGDDLVDLCHEVLITAWPAFASWVEARRADEQRRRQIQATADEWIARGRGATGLLDAGELAAALAWRKTDAACELGESAQVTALVEASRDASLRTRRRRRRWIASVCAGLVIFATVTATLAVIAQRQANVAEAERGKAEAALRKTQESISEAMKAAQVIVFEADTQLQNLAGASSVRQRLLTRSRELVARLRKLGDMTEVDQRTAMAGNAAEAQLAFERGHLDQASALYHEVLADARRRAAAEPRNAVWQHDLSVSYERLGEIAVSAGKLEDARSWFENALAVAKALAAADPSSAVWQNDLLLSYERLGEVAVSAGKLEDARGWFEKALAVAKALTAADPSNTGLQRGLAVSYEKLGDIAVSAGKLEDARGWFEKSLGLAKALVAADPSNAGWQRGLAVEYEKLGEVAVSASKLEDAHGWFEKGLLVAKALAEADPSNAAWQHDLSIYYEKLGDIAVSAGKLEDARGWFEKALAVAKALAAADPSNAGWQRGLAVEYEKLGEVAVSASKLEDARGWFEKALAVARALAAADPSNAGWQRDPLDLLRKARRGRGERRQARGRARLVREGPRRGQGAGGGRPE